jgi:hypothetical protein
MKDKNYVLTQPDTSAQSKEENLSHFIFNVQYGIGEMEFPEVGNCNFS